MKILKWKYTLKTMSSKIFMKKNILIIDDDDDLRSMLEEQLSFVPGIHIFEAKNGISGMDILSQSKVDLLMTDLLMPHQDGIDTILEVKKMYPRMKIIAISGSQDGLNKAKVFGADKVFSKPFDVEEIELVVKKMLDLK